MRVPLLGGSHRLCRRALCVGCVLLFQDMLLAQHLLRPRECRGRMPGFSSVGANPALSLS